MTQQAKVTLCHWANGHPHTITVAASAADTHLVWHVDTGWQPAPGHEHDTIGACPVSTTTTAPPTTSTTTAPPTTVTTQTPTTLRPQTPTTVGTPVIGVPVTVDRPVTELPATGFEPALLALGLLVTTVGLWLRKAARR